ncbi:hypothetical protein, partial [Pseudomonas sp. RW409]
RPLCKACHLRKVKALAGHKAAKN